MKRWRALILGLTLLSSTEALSKRKHGILVNLATFAFGSYEAAYEWRASKHFSISATANYYEGRKVLYRLYANDVFIGVGFLPKMHVYGNAHKNSFYCAPSVRLGYANIPRDESQGLLSRIGMNFGYQHVFHFGLMLDTAIGLEHYYNFSSKHQERESSSQIPWRIDIRPYFSIMIGYAF